MERKMVNAASGGAMVNKAPREAREIIFTMATNSQQLRTYQELPRRIHEVKTSSVEK